MDDWVDIRKDDAHVARERTKARELRRSQWWRRQKETGVCHYCGRQVGVEALTMDHVVPLSRGGKSRKGNVVPCCKECNSRKRTMLPIEWEEYLLSIAEREGDN